MPKKNKNSETKKPAKTAQMAGPKASPEEKKAKDAAREQPVNMTLRVIQLAIAGTIFLLFLSGTFFIEPYNLSWILFVLVLANIVFIFINGSKGLLTNMLLLGCTMLLRIFFTAYVMVIAGMLLSFFHLLRLLFRFLIRKK